MSIFRDYDAWIIFTCDRCAEDHNTGTNDWSEALHSVRQDDWLVCRDTLSDEWEHYCRDCAREFFGKPKLKEITPTTAVINFDEEEISQ